MFNPPWSDVFQSTPVIADGRTSAARRAVAASACFNPRPSLLTGEPGVDGGFDGAGKVFQSTPVIADGRTAARIKVTVMTGSFQSTPVIADGRTKAKQFADIALW